MPLSAVASSTAEGTLETRMSRFVQAAMSTWSYPAPSEVKRLIQLMDDIKREREEGEVDSVKMGIREHVLNERFGE